MAERVGFEPTSRFLANTLSKRAPSATRTPLRTKTAIREYNKRASEAPDSSNALFGFVAEFFDDTHSLIDIFALGTMVEDTKTQREFLAQPG